MSEKNKVTEQENSVSQGVSRRDLLVGMGAMATMAYAGSATAAMKGHDHSKHSTQLTDLMDAVNSCTDKGRRCIAHCLVSFVEGDTELAECASKVHEMMAVCGGFSYLVASNSGYTKEYSKICLTVCEDCAKECEKHDEHKECKACAEACNDVIDAIKLSLA